MNTLTSQTLTAEDRCDRCGAQAYIRVQVPGGELLFCAHHGRFHAEALKDIALHVHDESSRLFEEQNSPLTETPGI